MTDLLKLAVEAHGGLQRWEQLSRFRAAVSITGAIWDLKGNRPCWRTSCWRARPVTSG